MRFHQIVPTDTNIHFIDKFRYFLVFSALSIIGTGVGIYTKGLNYGVDFTGGTVIKVKFAESKPAEAVRKMVDESGEHEASVVSLGVTGQEFMITSRAPVEKAQIGALGRHLLEKSGPGKMQILAQDVVGPKVGQELKLAALRSLLYTVLLITIYIWFRFDFKFAPGATMAMLHDLAMMTGFYLVTGKEFTITAVAALLTIAGYSVNDTIVVYDRVREILATHGGKSGERLADTINHALNITLSRTLLTSGVTLLSILPIIFFCKGEIGDFALAMAFGIIVGTYSTIYIASPMTIYVEKWLAGRDKKTVGRHKIATA